MLVAAAEGAGLDGGRLHAQVVQLPAVRTFGMSGAVSVPDQGTMTLAGNRGSRPVGSVSGPGPLAGRGLASQSGGGSTSVSATVIDLQAMDEALLNRPADTPASTASNYTPRSTGTPIMNTLTPHLYAQRSGREFVPPGDPNAWEIALGAPGIGHVGTANALVGNDSAVRFYMLRAHEATKSGRNAAARVYYRMAYDRLTPEQRTRLQEIQRLADEQAGQAAAKASADQAGAGSAGAGSAGAAQ